MWELQVLHTIYNILNIKLGTLSGTGWGERSIAIDGKMFGFDVKNRLVAEVTYNPSKS